MKRTFPNPPCPTAKRKLKLFFEIALKENQKDFNKIEKNLK